MTKQTEQPPLGGCVLKQAARPYSPPSLLQPPLGGCVLKLDAQYFGVPQRRQPPLGGCVLKRHAGNERQSVKFSRL